MIMKIHVPFVALALSALGVNACRVGSDVDANLTVSVRADRMIIAQNDTAHFVVVLRNVGSEVATVTTPHCPHYYAVTDERGNSAGPPMTVCNAYALMPTQLAPGDSMVRFDRWAADSGREYDRTTRRVGPGTYSVIAEMWGTKHRLKSQPLVLEVR